MKYKLEVISAAAQRKEHYFDTLEEVLDEKERIKEQLKKELQEELERHKKVFDCSGECSSFRHKAYDYEVKFKIHLARWEVIG